MPGRLHAKRCLIVGGTGGLGLAAATRFLQEGAQLAVTGLTLEETQAALDALKNIGHAHCLACNASDSKQVTRLFEQTVAALGGLDVLYHVAGGSGRALGDGSLHECTDEGWRITIDVNLTGAFLTNRAAVQQFLRQGQGGVILNMASVLAFSPSPSHFDTAAYTAAKGGIIAMSRLAASRYAPQNIRVNVLAPGLIDTPMSRRAVTDPAILHFLKSKQPLVGGPGKPEDCADTAVFLCGDEAHLITGAVLPVDGGWCVSDGQL